MSFQSRMTSGGPADDFPNRRRVPQRAHRNLQSRASHRKMLAMAPTGSSSGLTTASHARINTAQFGSSNAYSKGALNPKNTKDLAGDDLADLEIAPSEIPLLKKRGISSRPHKRMTSRFFHLTLPQQECFQNYESVPVIKQDQILNNGNEQVESKKQSEMEL